MQCPESWPIPPAFVAVPAYEWTLTNSGRQEIGHGVGHKNIIFPSTEEAAKFLLYLLILNLFFCGTSEAG